jgi:predicted permease
MPSYLHDIRYSLRTLARSHGYTAVALLTLALGIGATTAMFTIVDGILLRPLPYAEPEALVRVYQASPERGLTRAELSPVDFADWREQSRAFAGVAAYWSGRSTLFGAGDAIEVQSTYVTEDFFPVLGVPMRLGRPLDAADLRQQSRVAVIGERLWRTRYGGRADLVGSAIDVEGEPVTVVGVAPEHLAFPRAGIELWLPHSLITEDSHGPQVRDNRHLDAIARLAPGVTPDRAQADLSAIAARLAARNPDTNREWGAATVVPLREVMTGDVGRPLTVVLAVVSLVLLIGCANLANLMLARASARQREIAIRTALGAGRWRIVRQLYTEALVLSVAGGALGLLLAVWCVDLMLRMSADTLPRVEEVSMGAGVIAFGVGVSVLTSLLFGLLPAMQVVRAGPGAGLRGGRGTIGSTGSRLRGALVVSQVTLAVLLVVAAGLMARSFFALRAVDPGFQPERVLTVEMSLTVPPV